MSTPQIGTTQRSPQHVEDAEFVEVLEAPPVSGPPPRRKRSALNAVFWVAIAIFVVIVALIAIAPSNAPADKAERQQMLAEWTRQVTGSVNDGGMVLIDGEGDSGSECDFDQAKQFVRFGGLRLVNSAGPMLYDAFRLGFAGQEQMVEGAFWFDPATSTITLSDTALIGPDQNVLQSLPDATVVVQPKGNGTLEFRGTQFHTCTLTAGA